LQIAALGASSRNSDVTPSRESESGGL